MKMKLCLLGVFLAFVGSAFEIVRDGTAKAEIVIAADAHEGTRRAAEDLRDYLWKISGGQFRIVTSPTAGVANRFYVGQSEQTRKLGYRLPEFRGSGYDILIRKNNVFLAGPMICSQKNPYAMSTADHMYLRNPLTNKTPKPAGFPSPGLKKWQEFTGRKFSTMQLSNGAGAYCSPLHIFVNDDVGDWYAVSAFLEMLGVRFYAPYEDGTVIPQKKTIVLKDQRKTSEAAFNRREWTYYNVMRSDREGVSWLKRTGCGNRTLIIFNHTTYGIYSTREQLALHPEYFAEAKPGVKHEGFPSGSGNPRCTDPGFRKDCVLYLRKVFEAFPNLAACAVGQPDGGVRLDYRDMEAYAKGGLSREQAASNYIWDFHVYLGKELAKTHPDKLLLYVSGSMAQKFPTNIRPDDPKNIVRPFAQPYSAYKVQNSLRKADLQNRAPWLQKINRGRKCPIWDYFLYYRTPSSPRYPVVFTASLQQEMQEMRSYADGKFIEVAPAWLATGRRDERSDRIGTVPLMHLMMYVQNKLLWDPDLDMKALLLEYYRLFFGPAAAEMQEFYEMSERIWTRQESRSVTLSTGFLKESDVPAYFAVLARARKKTDPASVYNRRIAAIEKEIQPLKKLFAGLKRTGPMIRSYTIRSTAPLDGNLKKYRHGWLSMKDNHTGDMVQQNRTDVTAYISDNRKFLRVAVVCYENSMKTVKAGTVNNDDFSIFNDDVVEVYLNSPEKSYFKIVVNANGAIYDESTDSSIINRDTLPILWNPGCRAVVKRYDDRWETELEIPVADLGRMGPSRQFPWGFLVGRTRMAGKTMRSYSLTPTGGAYKLLTKWGGLWSR